MIPDYKVEAAAKSLVKEIGGGDLDKMMESAKAAWRCQARAVLEAADAAKPEPEIPVTRDMLIAAGNATHENTSSDFDIYYAALYRAMFKARPKESGGSAACADGVSDEAVKAYADAAIAHYKKYNPAININPTREGVRIGLTAALPYLIRDKAGTTPKYIRSVSAGWFGSIQSSVENERGGKDRREQDAQTIVIDDTIYWSQPRDVMWERESRKSPRRKVQS